MPHRLGRYAVRRRIGSGGFATVWLAYDEQLDAPVAVKVLADNWTEDHQVRTRFIEEGRYLRRVESPHVVSVYDAGELEDGRPYLVMSYADQGTLADRLEVAGMSVGQGLEVVRQVAAGLQALHDRGILHRDVKPANVLFRTVEPGPVRPGGPGAAEGPVLRAMLGDLGLGKALDVSSRLTMIAGTPSFVAPEQAQGESPDARADQYSLGVLAFLLLGGRTPWTHASLSSAADPGPPPALSRADRSFPDAVEDVVRRALARERADRWPSVTAFVEALSAALADATLIERPGAAGASGWLSADPDRTRPGARPSPPPTAGPLPAPDLPAPPRRRPRRVATVVTALVVAAAVVGGGFIGGQALEDRLTTSPNEVTLADDTGAVQVTVPQGWDGARSTASWMPPNAGEGRELPAVSVGTSADWATTPGSAQGVFVGVLPGTELPDQVPQHLECDTASEPVFSTSGDTVTVVYSDCPDGLVVERVVQVNRSQLVWVQIRSADRATANRVLSEVRVLGLA